MILVPVEPLSINKAFQGKRFKTPIYKQFEKDCLKCLKPIKLPQKPFEVHYEFGFSSKLADLGNPEKLVSDVLCKKYGFDDRDIYYMTLTKKIVAKGSEYFKFEIKHHE